VAQGVAGNRLGAALAVFFVLWWAWYAFGWPPAGANRLAVALPVSAVVSAALSGPLFFWAGQPPRRPDARLSLAPATAGWVDRAELAEVVSALTGGGSGAVALTTGLVGAGGFGKTTLAARACADRRVRRRFRGGIVGSRSAGRPTAPGWRRGSPRSSRRPAELAGRRLLARSRPGGRWPGALAGRGRTLLVADDVWTAAQLEPFTAEGQPWRLLVTTRRPVVRDDVAARRIKVDAMPGPVARQLLTRDLPVMDARREGELLDLTGRWPLLLNLVNHRLAGDISRGAAIDAAALAAISRLRAGGPAALDVTDSDQRGTAVAATVGYSLDVLKGADRERFFELGVFAEDAEIPLPVAGLLWQGTAGMGALEAESLCERLDGLSLLTLAWAGEVRVLVLHDVIRDFALSRLGPAGTTAAHAALIGPAHSTLPAGDQDAAGWWRLPETPDLAYLWSYLTYHLDAAELAGELDETCCDLRFLAIRLRRSGPAAIESDLARSGSPVAGRLRRAVAQNAHLLGPIEPGDALITTFTSRLGDLPEVAAQLPRLRGAGCLDGMAVLAGPGPAAGCSHPGPDRPPGRGERGGDRPGRQLAGHRRRRPDGADLGRGWHPRAVTAIRIDGGASDCSWFASGTDLCIAGQQGLYRFSLQAPPG
jgi:APAF-1 helical domain